MNVDDINILPAPVFRKAWECLPCLSPYIWMDCFLVMFVWINTLANSHFWVEQLTHDIVGYILNNSNCCRQEKYNLLKCKYNTDSFSSKSLRSTSVSNFRIVIALMFVIITLYTFGPSLLLICFLFFACLFFHLLLFFFYSMLANLQKINYKCNKNSGQHKNLTLLLLIWQ